MKKYLIPEILIVLLLIGIAFIAGMSINENKVKNEPTNQLAIKITTLINKAIEKVDSIIDKLMDQLVEKLPEKVRKFGKDILRKGWIELKQSILNKVGAS